MNRSLASQASNTRALNLKTVVLRMLGQDGEARKLAQSLLNENPMDLISRNELERKEGRTMLLEMTRLDEQTFLEMASWYMGWGQWKEAVALLTRLEGKSEHPMLYYYLGYCKESQGEKEAADAYYEKAAAMPPDFCFPFRSESLHILEHVLATRPQDQRAPYYLGNQVFESMPNKALTLWEEVAGDGDDNPVLYRNLGLAYGRVKGDYDRAAKAYLQALKLRKDSRMVYELDLLYERAGASLELRQDLFDTYMDEGSVRVDALLRQVLVYIQSQRYGDAISLLDSHYFYRWEGGKEVRYYYEDAHQFSGLEKMRAGDCEGAHADFHAATEYPDNLEEGRPEVNPRFARSYYYLGLAEEKCGNRKKAREYYRIAAEEETGRSEFLYYRYLALEKLKEKEKASEVAERLSAYARSGVDVEFFAKFGERLTEKMEAAENLFILGLSQLVEGKPLEAEGTFARCLELNPTHSWARAKLAELE